MGGKGETEFPCGHTVSHEEACPRCEIERLQRELESYHVECSKLSKSWNEAETVCDRLRKLLVEAYSRLDCDEYDAALCGKILAELKDEQ